MNQIWQVLPFGWWVPAILYMRSVGDHSLTGQRMAPHSPQESPKVKTVCPKVVSCVFSPPWFLSPRARAYASGAQKENLLKPRRLYPTQFNAQSFYCANHPGGGSVSEEREGYAPFSGSGAKGTTGRFEGAAGR